MDFKVIWTDSAISDLKDICAYIARDNAAASEKTGRGILGHVKILETFPFIGPAYPRGSSGLIGEIVYGNYRNFLRSNSENQSGSCLARLAWRATRAEF